MQSLRHENCVLLLAVCQREELQCRGVLRCPKMVEGRALKTRRILLLQQSTPVYLRRLRTTWEPAVRTLRVVGGVKLITDQQHALYGNQVNYMLG